VISDGYGMAVPKSGIVMGAVFENVAISEQGSGVGRASGTGGPPCVLIAREEPIAPKPATLAAAKNNEQNRRHHRDGVNVRFGFEIIELPLRIGPLIAAGRRSNVLAKTVASCQHESLHHLPARHSEVARELWEVSSCAFGDPAGIGPSRTGIFGRSRSTRGGTRCPQRVAKVTAALPPDNSGRKAAAVTDVG